MRALRWVIAAVLMQGASCFAAEFEVFTLTTLPGIETHNMQVNIHYLDEPDLLKSQLDHFLPSDQQAAASEIQSFIASERGARFVGSLKSAFSGVFNAWAHDIERLPAILINDTVVVYGTYDVRHASELYQEFVRANRDGINDEQTKTDF